VLVSARRLQLLGLDRPAAALSGAVACVAFGVLTPDEAVAAVDGDTLLLLFGVMGMGALLATDGFFEQIEGPLLRWARTPQRLLGCLVWSAGLLSALVTNDAVCVLGTPLVVRLIRQHQLPGLPFLLALATAANTGSVATLVGNPQNMLCALLGDLEYLPYLTLMAPVAAVSLALNHGLLAFVFRGALINVTLIDTFPSSHLSRQAKASLIVVALTAVAYTLGAHLAWTAVAGFVLMMLLHRRDVSELWPRIDWSLLLFFAGLFIVVRGLTESGIPTQLFERFPLAADVTGAEQWARVSAIFLLGSNLVSNVPFILVVREQMATLPDPETAWQLLAMASTFAGNLTLLGSVANVIVAEAGRSVGGFGFWQHFKVGAPLALATTALGTLWVILLRT